MSYCNGDTLHMKGKHYGKHYNKSNFIEILIRLLEQKRGEFCKTYILRISEILKKSLKSFQKTMGKHLQRKSFFGKTVALQLATSKNELLHMHFFHGFCNIFDFHRCYFCTFLKHFCKITMKESLWTTQIYF